MTDPSEYDKATPYIQEHLEKFERALEKVRRTHGGRPLEEVRQALLEAFDSEGLAVWNEVVDYAAHRVASDEGQESVQRPRT
ncbi:hypothetical protein [Streptomyces sp. NPDC051677]|uniref:hypothetical protein n=1 Tax=Streptomyces sp. NPDC051677 TaxID=3365669 RepID=UPI0037CFAD55